MKQIYILILCIVILSSSVFSVTETLRPEANGFENEATPVGQTNEYECVDESVSNDDTDYVRTSTVQTYESELYDTQNISSSNVIITSVKTYGRCRCELAAGGACNFRTNLRTESTNYIGSTVTSSGTSWEDFNTTYTTNPNTATTWTAQQVQDMQIGVELYGFTTLDGQRARCTQVYAEVVYEIIDNSTGVYFYNVEDGMRTFTALTETGGVTTWADSTEGGSAYQNSPTHAFWIDNYDSGASRSVLTSENFSIDINSSSPKLKFYHRVNTEDDFDGGWLDFSINGGAWVNVNDSIIDGAGQDYSGLCGTQCPSGAHVAWEGVLPLQQVVVSIPDAAKGNDIAFQWIMESDTNTAAGGTDGWWVDDIQVSGVEFNNTLENLTLSPHFAIPSQNLTCNFDLTQDSNTSSIAWQFNSSPLMLLQLPFEGSINDAKKDYSGNDNTDMVVVNATWDNTTGHDGHGAYDLDGVSGYLSVPDSDSLDFGNQFTVSLWAKHEGGGVHDYDRIISRKNAFGDANGFEITTYSFIVDDNDAIELRGSGSTLLVAQNCVDSWSAGAWHHIVVVYNTTTAQVYCDGSFITSGAVGSVVDNDLDLVIGGNVAQTEDTWDGKIDDVRIYNRTLSAEQISAIYNNQSNVIVSQETRKDDVWSCTVTPFNYLGAGFSTPSNESHIVDLEVSFISPTPDNGTKTTINDTNIRVSSTLSLTVAPILEWNGTNFTMSGTGMEWYYNLTNSSDGLYSYKVFSNFSDILNMTETRYLFIDSVAPFVYCNFTDGRVFFENFTFSCNGTDTNLYQANYTLYNSSNEIVWNTFYDNISSTFHEVNSSTNITQGYQTYTLETCYNDDHNKFSDKNIKPIPEKVDNSHLRFNRGLSQRDSSVQMFFYNNLDLLVASPVTLQTDFIPDSDEWDMQFTVIAGIKYLEWEIKSSTKITDRSDTDLQGHFIWGEGRNKFYHDFNVSRNFTVNGIKRSATLTKYVIADNYTIIRWTPDIPLNNGDDVYIDPLTGGINVECINTSFSYESRYTAIEHFDIEISDVVIDSLLPVLIHEQNITIGTNRLLLFRGAAEGYKNDILGQPNGIVVRMDINGVTVFNRTGISMAGSLQSKVASFFLAYETTTSDINIKMYASDIGLGSVTLEDFEIHVLSEYSSNSRLLPIINFSGINTTQSTTPENIFNITLSGLNDSKVLIDFHDRINASGTTTPDCEIISPEGGIIGKFRRYLSNAIDVGSSGVSILDTINRTGTVTYEVFCNDTIAETVTHSYAGFAIGLKDSENRIINAVTNVTPQDTITSGENIINKINNYAPLDGQGVEAWATIGFSSLSGEQTPSFEILYDGTMSPIYERYISDSDEPGTVKFHSHLNDTMMANYTLIANISAGESIFYGSSLILLDVADLNTTIINVPPIIIIDNPSNNSLQLYDDEYINITVNDPDDNLDFCSADLYNYRNLSSFLEDDFETNIWSTDWRCNIDPYRGLNSGCSDNASTSRSLVLSSSQTSGVKTYSFRLKDSASILQFAMGEGDCFSGDDALCLEFGNGVNQDICDGVLSCNGTFTGNYDDIDIVMDRGNQTYEVYINNIKEYEHVFENNKNINNIYVVETGGAGNLFIDDIYVCNNSNIFCNEEYEFNQTINGNFAVSADIDYTNYSFWNYSIVVNCYDDLNLSSSDNIFIEAGNLQPDNVTITYPPNNSNVWYNNQDVNVTFTDSNNNQDYCNLSLLNDDLSLNTTINASFLNNSKIDYMNYALGNYSLFVTCFDEKGLFLNNSIDIIIFCEQNWTVQYTVCDENSTRTKYYTDVNNCTGGSIPVPADNNTEVGCIYTADMSETDYCTSFGTFKNGSVCAIGQLVTGDDIMSLAMIIGIIAVLIIIIGILIFLYLAVDREHTPIKTILYFLILIFGLAPITFIENFVSNLSNNYGLGGVGDILFKIYFIVVIIVVFYFTSWYTIYSIKMWRSKKEKEGDI